MMDAPGGVPTQPPERLCKLPVFRPVAVRLMSELAKDDPPLTRIRDLLSSDPGFSAEILTMANSAYYSRQTRVDTIQRAVMVLGLDRTRSLATTVALQGMIKGVSAKGAVQESWQHSRATAIIAAKLAPSFDLGREQAYTSGLMHDIGRLGLLAAYPEYPVLLEAATGSIGDLLRKERAAFSVDHCQAGLWLTRIWGLPQEFWDVTSDHHGALTAAPEGRIGLIRLSCALADALGFKAARKIEPVAVDYLAELLPQKGGRPVISPEDLWTHVKDELSKM
jgi:putative nucleotidyltransferase with HDIG domain